MRIDGLNGSKPLSKAEKKAKIDSLQHGGSDFISQVNEAAGAGQAEETASLSQSRSISNMDSLLSLQAMEDPTERASKNRMRGRANSVLLELDKIKIGLLSGTLTVGDVLNIADIIASHRERLHDPKLTAILDEIDLRAQIEIAKISMSLNKSID
jgi:hypothetical protein